MEATIVAVTQAIHTGNPYAEEVYFGRQKFETFGLLDLLWKRIFRNPFTNKSMPPSKPLYQAVHAAAPAVEKRLKKLLEELQTNGVVFLLAFASWAVLRERIERSYEPAFALELQKTDGDLGKSFFFNAAWDEWLSLVRQNRMQYYDYVRQIEYDKPEEVWDFFTGHFEHAVDTGAVIVASGGTSIVMGDQADGAVVTGHSRVIHTGGGDYVEGQSTRIVQNVQGGNVSAHGIVHGNIYIGQQNKFDAQGRPVSSKTQVVTVTPRLRWRRR